MQRHLTLAKLAIVVAAAASLATLALSATVAHAEWRAKTCSGQHCDGGINGHEKPHYDGGWTTQTLPVGANTERLKSGSEKDPYHWGFGISIDGERLVGDDTGADEQRRQDVSLADVDIQVKFDGLGVKPMLNVATEDLRHAYQAGDKITFVPTTNYPAWITRAEIRIHEAAIGPNGRPVKIIGIEKPNDRVHWIMPSGPIFEDATGEGRKGEDLTQATLDRYALATGTRKGTYIYVLRVYDGHGRYDETVPLGLARTSKSLRTHRTSPQEKAVSPGNGEDRAAVRNIPVYGGAVTVYGRDVPPGFRVKALGTSVPIDNNGAFVVQRILPSGDHDVDVHVHGNYDGDIKFSRAIHIPENEWFYVGLADATIGRRFGSKALVASGPGEYKNVYTKGRLAFYLKGKIRGRYILTAAADTGEDKVQNLFRNLDGKSPQDLLRRIDPDKYYPVYGDDSTAIEDAPTDGKFYVRLERGSSHVMWGRFKTSIRGTEFARNERQLYGAHAVYRSEHTTSHGQARVAAEAYASKPGTLPQRDNMRGTGGSLYFLSRQDVNRNSETIVVEVRERTSGIVVRRTPLTYGQDYDINYVQGVIILKKPLASSTGSDTIVGIGALGGDHQYLVAQYEYTPALGKIRGYSSGGRAQAWITDHVRVGVTGLSEETGSADQKVVGADVHVRLGPNSYIEAESAYSSGPGFGSTNSINGGLTIDRPGTAGRRNRDAWAHRAKAHVDLEDFDLGVKGHIGAHYEWRGAGFSSIGYDTTIAQTTIGAFAKIEARDNLRYLMKYAEFHDAAGKTKREGDAEFEYDFREHWSIGFGIKHTDADNPTQIKDNGGRTDIGSRLTYKPDEDHKYYVFGQATVAKHGTIRRNDRVGAGGEWRITEKIGLKGEVSYGSLGWGGLAGVIYDPTPDNHNYFGYKIDPERVLERSHTLTGADLGGIVLGAKHKYSDQVSAFIENNYDMFGHRRSLTSTYGVVYTPTALWVVNGGIEYGDVEDPFGGASLERIAVSGSVTYKDPEKISWRLKAEARFEDSPDPAKDRDTYLLSAGTTVKYDDNWRLLASFDAAVSDSDQSAILDGDYLKGSVGYAYRGTDHDNVNALFKYIFLYDMPGPDQITSAGSLLGPAQRSHILSADVSYDVSQHLTLGAKYGFRIGEVSETRSNKDFVMSSAHLGIIRADIHVVKNWDVLIEGRILHTPEIDTTKLGVVAGVYRHLGNNLKIGVGYNFGRFSDNVADLTHDESGAFLNVVGKF